MIYKVISRNKIISDHGFVPPAEPHTNSLLPPAAGTFSTSPGCPAVLGNTYAPSNIDFPFKKVESILSFPRTTEFEFLPSIGDVQLRFD